METNHSRKLIGKFVKNSLEAKAFLTDEANYLAQCGISLPDSERRSLRPIAEKLLKKEHEPPAAGGHTNLNTHTNYNASDGHVDRDSHTNHTSSF